MFDLLQYLYYVISFANFWQLTNSVFNDYNSHMTASRVSKSRMLGFFFFLQFESIYESEKHDGAWFCLC